MSESETVMLAGVASCTAAGATGGGFASCKRLARCPGSASSCGNAFRSSSDSSATVAERCSAVDSGGCGFSRGAPRDGSFACNRRSSRSRISTSRLSTGAEPPSVIGCRSACLWLSPCKGLLPTTGDRFDAAAPRFRSGGAGSAISFWPAASSCAISSSSSMVQPCRQEHRHGIDQRTGG
jgi:hypothetical protein